MRVVVPAVLLAATLAACGTTARDRELSRVQYDLAVEAQRSGDPRVALLEIEKAIEHDPNDPKARNFYALVLHLHFNRLDAAIAQYRKAVQLDSTYSEAKLNLGAALMAAGRFGEALAPLDEARRDLVFRDAHLAEGNYGWCQYRLGDETAAIEHLQSAVAMTPQFCLGYRNLAEIYEARGQLDAALRELDRYAAACPRESDAELRRGRLLSKKGEACLARDAYVSCMAKARGGTVADACGQELQQAGCSDEDIEIVIEGD